MRIIDISTAQHTILRRTAWDELAVPEALLDSTEQFFGERLTPDEGVRRILADVRKRGDAALLEWTQRLDRVTPVALLLGRSHIEAAYQAVDETVVAAL